MLFSARQLLPADFRAVLVKVRRVAEADAILPIVQERVGTRAQSQIAVAFPVTAVVPCAESGTGIIGDLVMLESTCSQRCVGSFKHVCGQVVIRQQWVVVVIPCGKGGSLFNGQAVDREVFGHQLQCLFKIATPHLHGLSRQGMNKVYADVVETCLTGDCNGVTSLLRCVNPAQCDEHPVIKGLDSNGESVDAGTAKTCQSLEIDGTRIGLQGYFSAVWKSVQFIDALQKLCHLLWRQK